MPDTIVSYHADGPDETARPAVNVKCQGLGDDYWPQPFGPRVPYWQGEPTIPAMRAREGYVEIAYDRVQEAFWHDAEIMAYESGLGEITQEGRSGGWLVFMDGRDPRDPETMDDCHDTEHRESVVREWLAAYRSMVEWADTWIADAPRKVRDLASQLAMDAAGEPAALRMFAFDRRAA